MKARGQNSANRRCDSAPRRCENARRRPKNFSWARRNFEPRQRRGIPKRKNARFLGDPPAAGCNIAILAITTPPIVPIIFTI